MLTTANFCAFHAAVHGGKQPFVWQHRLLEQIVRDKCWPRVLDLPTGAGKTTCIDIALFALALDSENEPRDRWCPRRIVMVVDRRIVVDQVAERGRSILRALTASEDPIVVEVARRLRSLTRNDDQPLSVFTLRGGMPKDDGWARAPDQPLVIASTVDQVGSRMLMQGYGVSPGMKPVHAGLLANDTLLLLDEVHLSEPFRQTLDQLARLRTRFSGSGLKTRFSHVFLSATPGASATPRFALLEDEKKPDSPLGPRLHASKPTRLVEVDDRPALEKTCIDQAKDLLNRHSTIAVVVNRVASASVIAQELGEILGTDATVTLLTGRMRPLDRDDVLRELRPAVQTGRNRSDDSARRVIVGTQCIEAGADFDFDALVTEAASLDCLRQRFGRVDRLGQYKKAEGVIVYDRCAKLREELKRRGEKPSLADNDPIYGPTIVETVKWFKIQEKERPKKLKEELKRLQNEAKKLKGEAKQHAENQLARMRQVDFGVLALEVPGGAELTKLLAPKQNAPTLLPLYLDLWAQTSPAPSQLPDVSLWLHGPNSEPADVQVVWRADLTEEVLQRGAVETAAAIVAAVRPSSLEAISLPFMTARAWLANQPTQDMGDTEGSAPDVRNEATTGGRRALCWRGGESEIICAQSDSELSLKPGDTIVVPVTYGGIRGGCFDSSSTEPVQDRAEQAELFARARPVLRLNSRIVEWLEPSLDDPNEARAALARLASNGDWPPWKRLWAEKLSKGQRSLVVPGDEPWTVIEAKRVPNEDLQRVLLSEDTLEDGIELTTDDDDSVHAGRAVSLAEHSADVEKFAREYVISCGLDSRLVAHVAIAAWLHDIGKADRRFQLMLRGGSEIEFFKDETPWAKSAMPPGAHEAHRLAQQKSGYPRGARHEVQSLAMIQENLGAVKNALEKVGAAKEPDLDLVLHLVASHHGYCRPFASAVVDEKPSDVTLANHTSEAFGRIDFSSTSTRTGLSRLDSPLADRFWTLVARYGWQELCWIESILRLADHRASEEEQKKEASQ
jgi:CRISPR-associated endonuclease/helicase Cas3